MPDSLPARLVRQAAEAIARARPDRDGTMGEIMADPSYWSDEARAAVVSVLDTLARHPFELNPGDRGPFVTYEDVARQLRALAREVREGT